MFECTLAPVVEKPITGAIVGHRLSTAIVISGWSPDAEPAVAADANAAAASF